MGLITGTRRGKAGRSKSMARRPRGHEKIKMDKKRHGYFPQRFTWRGRHYDVQAVERCWTVSRKRLGNRVERLCFRVRCVAVRGQNGRSSRAIQEGTVVLYQDLNGDSWHLEKVISRT